MQLNITFFLQIINFLITYLFLNKFMFKPVIKFLKDKKNKEKKVLDEIFNKEQVLLNLEYSKLQDLKEFKEDIKEQYEVETLPEPNILSKIKYSVDKKEAEKLIKVAKEILIEKVPHVD